MRTKRCKGWAFFLWIIEAAMSGSLNMERPYLQATVIVSFVLSFVYKLVCNCTNPFVNDGNQPFWLQQPFLHNIRANVGGPGADHLWYHRWLSSWRMNAGRPGTKNKLAQSRRRCHKCFGHWALKVSGHSDAWISIVCVHEGSLLSCQSFKRRALESVFSLRHSGKGRCISLSDASRLPIEQYCFRFRFQEQCGHEVIAKPRWSFTICGVAPLYSTIEHHSFFSTHNLLGFLLHK